MAKAKAEGKKLRGSTATYLKKGQQTCDLVKLAKAYSNWGEIPKELSDVQAGEIALMSQLFLQLWSDHQARKSKGTVEQVQRKFREQFAKPATPYWVEIGKRGPVQVTAFKKRPVQIEKGSRVILVVPSEEIARVRIRQVEETAAICHEQRLHYKQMGASAKTTEKFEAACAHEAGAWQCADQLTDYAKELRKQFSGAKEKR
jgi:hypothetical protein